MMDASILFFQDIGVDILYIIINLNELDLHTATESNQDFRIEINLLAAVKGLLLG